MNRVNYQCVLDTALEVRAKGFNVREHFGSNRITSKWGHFMSSASKVCGLGLNGSSFLSWVSGLYENSVFVYSRNYSLGMCIKSDPTAPIFAGCQDSHTNGNPFPSLGDNAEWIQLSSIEDEVVRNKAIEIANKIMRNGANCIIHEAHKYKCLNQRDRLASKMERKAQEQLLAKSWGINDQITKPT